MFGKSHSGWDTRACKAGDLPTSDPTEKLEALAAMVPPMLKPGRFRAPDKLLAMLRTVGRPSNYAE